MRANIIRIANLILAVFLALFVAGYCFAWFGDQNKLEMYAKINGVSDGGYFESGSGSKDDPFILTNANHLYNLSWLQNVGRLENQHYYFKLNADITVGDLYIAPIGNAEYPFCGEFNGAGKKISGLKVTTDKELLRNEDPAKENEYEFSNSVGLFGKVNEGGVVKNFILVNPSVEVEENAKYSAYSEDACVVGLAIGDVQGKASNIGVYGGALSVQRTGYLTKNSIVGKISEYESVSEAVQSGNGGNTGYLVPDNIVKKVNTNTDKKINTKIFSKEITANSDYNLSEDENAYEFQKIWLVSNDNDTTLSAGDGSSNYLGLGCFSIINSGEMELRPGNVYSSFKLAIADDAPDQNGCLNYNISSTQSTVVDITNEAYFNQDYISMIGGSGGAANEEKALKYALYLGNSPKENESFTVVSEKEGGYLYKSESTLYNVSSNTIRFYVQDPLNFEVVVVVGANSAQERSLAISKTSSAIEGDFYFNERYYNLEDYAETEAGGKESLSANDLKEEPLQKINFNTVEPVVCKLNLKDQKGAGAGVYSINSTGNSVYIYYLAVKGAQGSVGTTVETGIKGIDFIDENDETVKMVQSDQGEYVFEYTPTGTLISFTVGNSAAVIIYFDRVSDGNYTIKVQTDNLAGRPVATNTSKVHFVNTSGLVYPREI